MISGHNQRETAANLATSEVERDGARGAGCILLVAQLLLALLERRSFLGADPTRVGREVVAFVVDHLRALHAATNTTTLLG